MPRRRGKKEQEPEPEPKIVSSPDRGVALLRFAAQMQRELAINDEKGWGYTEADRERMYALLDLQFEQTSAAMRAQDMPMLVPRLVDLANMCLIVAETVPADQWPDIDPIKLANCAFISEDGLVCRAAECSLDDIVGRLESLRRRRHDEEAATERFSAKLKGGTLNADGELTISLTPTVGNPWDLHQRTIGRRGQQAEVSMLFAPAKEEPEPAKQDELPLQQPAPPEPITVIACAVCHQIHRLEGAKAGDICMYCALGEQIETSVLMLECSNCKQPQVFTTESAGEMCGICKEGRYLLVGQPAAQPEPVKPPDDVIYVAPDRMEELSAAISGLTIQNAGEAKALVMLTETQYAITQILSSDPATFEAWRAVALSEYGEDRTCHLASDSQELHEMRILVSDGAPFVLVGPPMRVIVAEAEHIDDEPEMDGSEALDDATRGIGEDDPEKPEDDE